MLGQALEFRNSDPEAHNVHGRPQVVDGWNFMMSRPGATRDVYFDKPEVGIPVGCDVHPWMRAYSRCSTNPYFAVTPADGTVTLSNVPPGDYVVGVWHETLGTQEQSGHRGAEGQRGRQLMYQANRGDRSRGEKRAARRRTRAAGARPSRAIRSPDAGPGSEALHGLRLLVEPVRAPQPISTIERQRDRVGGGTSRAARSS